MTSKDKLSYLSFLSSENLTCNFNKSVMLCCVMICLSVWAVLLNTVVSTWFERVSIMVILLNCMTLGMYQPCENIDCSSDRCQVLQVHTNIHKHILDTTVLPLGYFFLQKSQTVFFFFKSSGLWGFVRIYIIYTQAIQRRHCQSVKYLCRNWFDCNEIAEDKS